MLRFRASAHSAFAVLLIVWLSHAQAQAAQFQPGSRVEGHIGSNWAPCVVNGPQLPTGGYRLHCDSLPDPENVFSESDVRELGVAQPAPVARALAAPEGRPVQGRIRDNWENCTMLGAQLPTGGYRLHCDSLPDAENIFSASDVREFGAAQPAPLARVLAVPEGRPVQGRIRDNWENCTMLGAQLPTGGYRLHCDSLPDAENVFSASDVRF